MILVAWWSLFYWLGLWRQWSLWPSGWIWLAGCPVIAVAVLYADHRSLPELPGYEETAVSRPLLGTSASSSPVRVTMLGSGVAALAAAAVVLATWPAHFRIVWLLVTVALVLGVLGRLLRPAAVDPAPRERALTDVAAAALAVAVGVFSLFVQLPDLDDPFYINRSVWVAEHGNASLLDTMFGPQVFHSPYNGGIPIASIEALFGVLAHMTGWEVGTIVWVLATAVGSAMAVWALWRLCRSWSVRWPLLVLVIAVLFMLLSGESRLGNFWIARMWQGKVLAVAILIPMIWVYATQVTQTRSRRPVVMLGIAGAAFVGLTSTAVILAPIMSAAILVAACLFRSRRLVAGALLLSVVPVLSGGAVAAFSEDVGGADPPVLTGMETFVRVLGPDHVMVGLAIAGMAASAYLVRPVLGSLMAALCALVSLAVLVPVVLTTLNDLSGAGPILWRVLYCLPIAVFVGMLAVVPLPKAAGSPVLNTAAAALLPVVVAGLIVAGGAPLWTTVDHNGPVTLADSPVWKVNQKDLADVRAVMATDPHGVIVLPPRQMRLLPQVTTQAFAVVPRTWYADLLEEPKENKVARFQLSRLAAARTALPTQEQVDAALVRLGVSLVCVGHGPRRHEAVLLLKGAGFTDKEKLNRLTCLSAPS